MQPSKHSFLLQVLQNVFRPSFLFLCLAGGIRQGGGLVWAYNVKAYFARYYCSPISVGIYLSWVPLVGGTIGAVFGGLISDKLVKHKGQTARFWVLIFSQLLACPFLIGAVLLPPDPWAFLCLLPAYMVGEVWIGVCLAVIIDMVPSRVVAVAVAVFLFIINNIGGLLPLLIPLMDTHIGLHYTLLVLYPGAYFGAAVLFALTLTITKCPSCSKTHFPALTSDDEEGESELLIQAEDSEIPPDDLTESYESLLLSSHRSRGRPYVPSLT